MGLGLRAEITRWRFPAGGGANSGRSGRGRGKIESISGCLRSLPQAPLSLPSKHRPKPSGDRRDKAGAVVDRRVVTRRRRVEGRLAGFVLVMHYNYFTGEHAADCPWVIAEFFVMRKYRRQGVGRAAAFQVFDRFPGRWEVAEITSNVGAQAFWRKVIGEYTGGDFAETVLDDESWHGPVQSFDNSRKARAQ